MKLELGNRFRAARERASKMARTGVDHVKNKASKIVSDSDRLTNLQTRAQKLQNQTKDGLAKARATIQAAKENPRVQTATAAVQSAKDTIVTSAAPHIETATGVVKAQVIKSQDAIKQKTGEVRTGIESRAVGWLVQQFVSSLGNPETFENLRAQLSESVPAKIKSKAQEVNGDGLSPQRLLRQELAPDGLDGIKSPAFEAVAYVGDRAAVLSGWMVANTLKHLLLPGSQVIEQADVNSIIAGGVVAPTIRFADRTAGTIYNRAQSAIQSRLSSGPTPNATA